MASHQPSRIDLVTEQGRKEFLALSPTDQGLVRDKTSQPIPQNKDNPYQNGNARKRRLRHWHLRDNLIIVFKAFDETGGRRVLLSVGTHDDTERFSDNYNGKLPAPRFTLVEAGILTGEETASKQADVASPPESRPPEPSQEGDEQLGKQLLAIIRGEARAASTPEVEAAVDSIAELAKQVEAVAGLQTETDETLRRVGAVVDEVAGQANQARTGHAELERALRLLTGSVERLDERQRQHELALVEVRESIADLLQAHHLLAQDVVAEGEQRRLVEAAHLERGERDDASIRRLDARTSDHSARLNLLDDQQRQSDGRLAEVEHGLEAMVDRRRSWFAGVKEMFWRWRVAGG